MAEISKEAHAQFMRDPYNSEALDHLTIKELRLKAKEQTGGKLPTNGGSGGEVASVISVVVYIVVT